MKTTDKLAAALEAADAPPDMVERARSGYYDDFTSPLDLPAMQLEADARAAGLHDIARRVIAGEFDSTREESEAWARSADGQATFRSLLGGR